MAAPTSAPLLSQTLLSKLACPHCRHSLELKEDRDGGEGHDATPGRTGSPALRCSACGRRFPIQDGIPLLFPEERPADWAATQKALYDGIAPHYDGSIPAHVAAHYLTKRVDVVTGLAPHGAAVLDVGCGTGTLARAIALAGYDVYGLDASTGMLAQLAVATTSGAGRGQPVAGFGERLPFADGAFDLAITVATLHHITDRGRIAATIGEMCRVTRAGGHVVIWDHNPKNPYWPLLMKRVPQDTGEERLVPQEEIVADLRAAGVTTMRAHRSGLVPDFTPPPLLGLARAVERVVEATPGLNIFCAHNVVVAYKR
ncbi:MAG: methyltransferase domain-containing protein [Chloroflexota bacterium]|nr:methyltransferase domain-containing protein [Chloroflexota bacterium]